MKNKKEIPLHQQRAPKLPPEPETDEPLILRDAVAMPAIGLTIPVRAAKAKLSALLELVAGGQRVTITSDGKPKAVLLPATGETALKVFTGTWDRVKHMPLQNGGPTAEELVRMDRDGRGW